MAKFGKAEDLTEILAALMDAGLRFKLYGYRVHADNGLRYDGPYAFEFYIDTSYQSISAKHMAEIEAVVGPLGFKLWFGADQDGHPGLHLEPSRRVSEIYPSRSES